MQIHYFHSEARDKQSVYSAFRCFAFIAPVAGYSVRWDVIFLCRKVKLSSPCFINLDAMNTHGLQVYSMHSLP